MCVQRSLPRTERNEGMSLTAFSCYIGISMIIVIPVMVTLTYSDTLKSSSRRERLSTWQLSTLIATTLLAIYTKMFVESGGVVLVDTTTLWVFCALGVVLSISLGITRWLLTQRQRKLEDRLVEAVLRP